MRGACVCAFTRACVRACTYSFVRVRTFAFVCVRVYVREVQQYTELLMNRNSRCGDMYTVFCTCIGPTKRFIIVT